MLLDVDMDRVVAEARRLLVEIVQELDGERFYLQPGGRFVAEKMDMLRMALSLLDHSQLTQFIDEYVGDDHQSTF